MCPQTLSQNKPFLQPAAVVTAPNKITITPSSGGAPGTVVLPWCFTASRPWPGSWLLFRSPKLSDTHILAFSDVARVFATSHKDVDFWALQTKDPGLSGSALVRGTGLLHIVFFLIHRSETLAELLSSTHADPASVARVLAWHAGRPG